MAMVVLVASEEAGEPLIGPSTAERLAMLGVTRVSLLRDGPALGVVLDGWAFDGSSAQEAASALFPSASEGVRKFSEVQSVFVSSDMTQRRI